MIKGLKLLFPEEHEGEIDYEAEWMKTELKYYFDKYDKSNHPDPYTCYDDPNYVFRQWVYLFYNPVTGLSKIGITQYPKNRLRQLSNQNGVKLIPIIHSFMDSHFDPHPIALESFLHESFKSKRTIGEWFNLDFNDITKIVYFFGFDHSLEIDVEYEQIGEDYMAGDLSKDEFLEWFKNKFF